MLFGFESTQQIRSYRGGEVVPWASCLAALPESRTRYWKLEICCCPASEMESCLYIPARWTVSEREHSWCALPLGQFWANTSVGRATAVISLCNSVKFCSVCTDFFTSVTETYVNEHAKLWPMQMLVSHAHRCQLTINRKLILSFCSAQEGTFAINGLLSPGFPSPCIWLRRVSYISF